MNPEYSQFLRIRHGRERLRLALALALLFAFMAPATVRAEWQVDEARFHISAHKDIACADCHEAVTGAKRHPEPDAVNNAASSAFSLEQCLTCHESVQAALDKTGTHGGQPLQTGKDYTNCVTCHNPHTVMLKSNIPPSFDEKRPVREQCNVCHEGKTALPALSKDDESCMSCHRKATGPAAERLCFSCHYAENKMEELRGRTGVLDEAAVKSATHREVACAECHKKSVEFPHNKQQRVACVQCHVPHGESQAHDAHIGVECESCHLAGVTPRRKVTSDGRGAGISFIVNKEPLLVHNMRPGGGDASCVRCHFAGNTFGAAAAALPAKSILCMGCHAATFTVGDASTFPFLLFFCGAMLVMGMFWLTKTSFGGGGHTQSTASPSGRFTRVLTTVFLDILLQRGLYREDRERWGIHALIFFPFLFRFLWGMTALLASLWMPEQPLPWLLINKNAPLGGLLFDVSGLALLAGLILAARHWLRHPRMASGAVLNLPRRDWAALVLLGGITSAGFVLEGMRIAMTGMPDGAGWSFVGYMLALPLHALITEQSLTGAYVWVWYVHALLTGLTVAYIPFSQLRHIITSPLYMIFNALGKEK